jgi:hypothetical protein
MERRIGWRETMVMVMLGVELMLLLNTTSCRQLLYRITDYHHHQRRLQQLQEPRPCQAVPRLIYLADAPSYGSTPWPPHTRHKQGRAYKK